MALELQEQEKRIVATAITSLSLLVILAAGAGALFLIGLFLRRFSDVFLPVAVAGVLALLLAPYHGWLRRRLGLPRPLAIAALFTSVLLPLLVAAVYLAVILTGQILEIAAHAPAWWDQLRTQTAARWPELETFWRQSPWAERLRQFLASQHDTIVATLGGFFGQALSAGAGVARGVGSFLHWLVVPVYVGFLLAAAPGRLNDKDILPFLRPATRRDVVFLGREFLSILVAFFRGQCLIALIQAVLLVIGFSVVGLHYALALGLLVGLANVVPFLGMMLGVLVVLPAALFQEGGGVTRLLAAAAIMLVVALIEGQVLTPRIMGQRTGLHPMVIMVSIFFWGSALGGIAGMLLAVPLTAFLVVFWRLAREKYIREIV